MHNVSQRNKMNQQPENLFYLLFRLVSLSAFRGDVSACDERTESYPLHKDTPSQSYRFSIETMAPKTLGVHMQKVRGLIFMFPSSFFSPLFSHMLTYQEPGITFPHLCFSSVEPQVNYTASSGLTNKGVTLRKSVGAEP